MLINKQNQCLNNFQANYTTVGFKPQTRKALTAYASYQAIYIPTLQIKWKIGPLFTAKSKEGNGQVLQQSRTMWIQKLPNDDHIADRYLWQI